jgi:CDP-glucose 4,6-dehydratase
VRRVVLVSSYLGYGRGETYREDMPLRPSTVYGAASAAADLIARSYAPRVGVGVVRLGNVYGGGDVHYSRLVPDAVRALADGRRPVIRSDGTPQRDFLYVEDAVEACLAVAGSLPGHSGEAWNAGAGKAVAILDLVRMLARVAGREDLEPDVRGAAAGAVDRQVLDTAKIRDALGWAPRFGLEEGLARTWEWYRAHGAAAGRPAA